MPAFTINAKLAVFVALFFPLTLNLGFWQLDRAEQKRLLIQDQRALVDNPVLRLDSVAGSTLSDYTPVSATGKFSPQVYLLDNQVFKGQVGYEVVQPFMLQNHDVVFVSRGFVPGSPDRNILPDVKTPEFEVSLQGYAYQPKKNTLIDETEPYKATWPVRVQALDVEILYNHWSNNVRIARPFLESSIIRLDTESPFSFDSHWMLVNNSPEKHVGYAVQWFSMAALLLVLFIWSCFSSKPDKNE